MNNLEIIKNQKISINNLKQENLKLMYLIKNTNSQISDLQEEIQRIHSSRFFKVWQKIKKIKQTLKIAFFFSKRDKILSLNNIFITLIINFKNKSSEKTDQFIHSIFSQSYPNIEVICLTSKSTPRNTKKLFKQLHKQKNNIKSMEFQNINLVDAINQAKGKYICYLKPNYILHPNYLEKCIIKMEIEKLDVCVSDIGCQLSTKNKKINLNKLIFDPEYAVVKKQYLKKIIGIKKPYISKINEPLIEII